MRQKITIKKLVESSFIKDLFSAVTSLFSSPKEDKVTLTTDYQSFDKNTQVYLQLVMRGYKSGDYIITVSVNDKLAGKETSSETLLKWR